MATVDEGFGPKNAEFKVAPLEDVVSTTNVMIEEFRADGDEDVSIVAA